MLAWYAETIVVATVLAAVALLAGRWLRLRPVARHALWLVVLIRLVAPPIVSWPWSLRLGQPTHGAAETPISPRAVSVDDPGALFRTFDTDGQISLAQRGDSAGRMPWPDIHISTPALRLTGRMALGVWGVASVVLAGWQVCRVLRFRRRFGCSVPAPGWLVDEARRIGRRLGVRVPEILVLPGPTMPMLWFLGRPRLLVPAQLVESLGVIAWQGILAHELAHLLRLDHWVRRLELAAGLLWWWNPLYWLTRRRLEVEAELACDECAVRAFPDGRLAYAEALLEVCRSLSMTEPLAPALGVAGGGQFLERRVTMILREQNPSRPSAWVFLGAGLLAVLALPSWSASASPSQKQGDQAVAAPSERSKSIEPITEDEQEAIDDADDDDVKPADRPKREESAEENELKQAESKELKQAAEMDLAKKKAAESDARQGKEKIIADLDRALRLLQAKKKAAEAGAGQDEEEAAVELKRAAAMLDRAKKRVSEAAARQKEKAEAVDVKRAAMLDRAKKKLAEAAARQDEDTSAVDEKRAAMFDRYKKKLAEAGAGQDEDEVEMSLKLAKSNLDRAQDRLKWTSEMRKKRYASQAQLTADQLAQVQAKLALSKAELAKRAAADLKRTARLDGAKKRAEHAAAHRKADVGIEDDSSKDFQKWANKSEKVIQRRTSKTPPIVSKAQRLKKEQRIRELQLLLDKLKKEIETLEDENLDNDD